MKQIFLAMAVAALLVACNENKPAAAVDPETNEYEAYGLLTIPSSGFEVEDVRAQAVLVNETELDLYMFGVKFSAGMPVTIDMVISGVGYTRNANGILFSGEDIVPTAGNKSYEKYIVTGLSGRITADSLCWSNNYGDTPAVYAGALSK